jgi:hypothetical protein
MGVQGMRNETDKIMPHFQSRHLKGNVHFADIDESTARRKPAITNRWTLLKYGK